jgi:hypothetical protein
MSANSSSTNDEPTPTRRAEAIDHPVSDCAATPMYAPVMSRMMPGTEWWMWVPLDVTLSLNGPRSARIIRVMTRVVMNVTTKAAKHRNSGSRPESTKWLSNHDAMPGW